MSSCAKEVHELLEKFDNMLVPMQALHEKICEKAPVEGEMFLPYLDKILEINTDIKDLLEKMLISDYSPEETLNDLRKANLLLMFKSPSNRRGALNRFLIGLDG